MRYEFQLNARLKTIALGERAQITTAVEKRFHRTVGLEPDDLAAMELELLVPLRDLVRGILLTKGRKPDMKKAYPAFLSMRPPRKTDSAGIARSKTAGKEQERGSRVEWGYLFVAGGQTSKRPLCANLYQVTAEQFIDWNIRL